MSIVYIFPVLAIENFNNCIFLEFNMLTHNLCCVIVLVH